MKVRQLREPEGLAAVINKRIFGIGVVLFCIILIEFLVVLHLLNKEPETIIQEVEIVKEVEVIKEVPIEVETEPTYTYNITSAEREMLARIVFLESNTESIECQKAVVSVIINRWQDGYWGDTLRDVIYAKNQFTPSHHIYKTTPTETNYAAVDYVLKYGCTIPEYVKYFRTNHHFNWSGYEAYIKIDHTCFGYLDKDKK